MDLFRINVTTGTIPTYFCKLNATASNSTKSIKYIGTTFNTSTKHISNSLSHVLTNRLRCATIPSFIINLYSIVEFTKKKESIIPVFLQLFSHWHICYLFINDAIFTFDCFRISIIYIITMFKHLF